MLAARITLAAVALIVCAWFALGIRQTRNQERADALIHQAGTPTKAQTVEVLALLRRSSELNPDRTIDLLRAMAEVRAGEVALAERQMKNVVRDEPMNVDAWINLAFAARQRDPTVAQLAREKQLELVPPVAPGR
jgi:Tfp pilus assembly protein PilF